MRITSGKVVAGQIVIGEGEPLPEGAPVTVLVRDEETFRLDDAAKAELLESLAEADRGEVVSLDEVMKIFRDE